MPGNPKFLFIVGLIFVCFLQWVLFYFIAGLGNYRNSVSPKRVLSLIAYISIITFPLGLMPFFNTVFILGVIFLIYYLTTSNTQKLTRVEFVMSLLIVFLVLAACFFAWSIFVFSGDGFFIMEIFSGVAIYYYAASFLAALLLVFLIHSEWKSVVEDKSDGNSSEK